MRIIIFTLFFLVALLTGLAFFNTSQLIHDNAIEIWNLYDDNNTSVIGIFTLLGTILTAFVFFVTAKATKNASDSVSLARDSLSLSEVNNKKDEFLRRFSMLLEQHNNHLDIVKKYLDENNNFTAEVMGLADHLQAFNKLRGHTVISPYMRILYHLLKHICVEFYIDENLDPKLKERKKFSSLVRSLIRNDVLSLIAVNSSYVIENGEYNQYKDYQILLKKFDFFQHVNFFATIENTLDDIEILKIEYDSILFSITNRYTNYHDNYLKLVTNKEKLGTDEIENTTLDRSLNIKVNICIITAIIFNNKTNRLANSLFTDLVSSLDITLTSHDENFLDEHNKKNLVDKFIDCRIGTMPNPSIVFITERDKWEELKKSEEKFNEVKLNSVILTKVKINILYYAYATNIKILNGDEFIFKDNCDSFFIPYVNIEHYFKENIHNAKITHSIKNGSYKKYRHFIINKYNEKLNSILSQSISLDDEKIS